MPHTHFTLARRTLLAAAALALTAPAWAQSFPTKPVKLVVPYPAGGPIDGVARGLAERLQRLWGQPVVVDNRGGANEIIAGDFTAKSPADGYTILLGADPTFSGNPFLFKKLPFNPFTDLVPITRVVNVNMAFIVPGNLPVNTLKEFVALIKANPNKYNYGSAGAGGPTHVQVDAFLRQEDLPPALRPASAHPPTWARDRHFAEDCVNDDRASVLVGKCLTTSTTSRVLL